MNVYNTTFYSSFDETAKLITALLAIGEHLCTAWPASQLRQAFQYSSTADVLLERAGFWASVFAGGDGISHSTPDSNSAFCQTRLTPQQYPMYLVILPLFVIAIIYITEAAGITVCATDGVCRFFVLYRYYNWHQWFLVLKTNLHRICFPINYCSWKL